MWITLLLSTALQEPGVDDLIRRLRDEDHAVRHAAAEALSVRGEAVLPAVRGARETESDPEAIALLSRVEIYVTHEARFSSAFRDARPDLVEQLRNPTPEIVLDALGAATGWTNRLGRAIDAKKVDGAARRDGIEVLRAALRAMPVDGAGEWVAVRGFVTGHPELLRDGSLFPVVYPHFRSMDADFRGTLVQTVNAVSAPTHTSGLIDLVGSANSEVRWAAAAALSRFDPGSDADELIDLLESADSHTRLSLLQSISRTRNSRYESLLLASLSSHEGPELADALRRVAPDAFRTWMLEGLASTDDRRLMGALRVADSLDDPDVIAALCKVAAGSKNSYRVTAAIRALARLEAPPLGETIVASLAHREERVRRNAAREARFAPKTPDLVEALVRTAREDAEADVRGRAAESLAALGAGDLRGLMIEWLDAPDVLLRAAAAESLGLFGDPRDAARIAPLLDSREARVVMAAETALGRLRAREYEDDLKRHPGPSTLSALARMGSPAAVERASMNLIFRWSAADADALARARSPEAYRIVETA